MPRIRTDIVVNPERVASCPGQCVELRNGALVHECAVCAARFGATLEELDAEQLDENLAGGMVRLPACPSCASVCFLANNDAPYPELSGQRANQKAVQLLARRPAFAGLQLLRVSRG